MEGIYADKLTGNIRLRELSSAARDDLLMKRLVYHSQNSKKNNNNKSTMNSTDEPNDDHDIWGGTYSYGMGVSDLPVVPVTGYEKNEFNISLFQLTKELGSSRDIICSSLYSMQYR